MVQTNPLEKINMLMQLGVEVVICGGITEICSNKFNDSGMQVIPWVRGEAEEVLSQFLAGKLAKIFPDRERIDEFRGLSKTGAGR
ncbi:hypothetical protein FBQ85_13445 [Cytophagia bacterium CHB2]|nr:hypothetical protein [Cytophagia bacterium CHB2]